MHCYNTRFQARLAAKKLVQAQTQALAQVPLQAPAQASKKDNPYQEDINFLKRYLGVHGSLLGMRYQIKNAKEIFSYLAIHPGLLIENIQFRQVIRNKIADLRCQIVHTKDSAINTFIGWDHRNQTEEVIQRLENARVILAECKQLEEEFKKVEAYLQ